MSQKQSGSRAQVMNGTVKHTQSGLTKGDLKYNKHGRIVSKIKSTAARKNPELSDWVKALKKARSQLNITGFVPVGGKTKEGKELYKTVKEIYYK